VQSIDGYAIVPAFVLPPIGDFQRAITAGFDSIAVCQMERAAMKRKSACKSLTIRTQ